MSHWAWVYVVYMVTAVVLAFVFAGLFWKFRLSPFRTALWTNLLLWCVGLSLFWLLIYLVEGR